MSMYFLLVDIFLLLLNMFSMFMINFYPLIFQYAIHVAICSFFFFLKKQIRTEMKSGLRRKTLEKLWERTNGDQVQNQEEEQPGEGDGDEGGAPASRLLQH